MAKIGHVFVFFCGFLVLFSDGEGVKIGYTFFLRVWSVFGVWGPFGDLLIHFLDPGCVFSSGYTDFRQFSMKKRRFRARNGGRRTVDDDDDDDGGDDDRPGSSRSPSNAPRDQISREGTPSLRF